MWHSWHGEYSVYSAFLAWWIFLYIGGFFTIQSLSSHLSVTIQSLLSQLSILSSELSQAPCHSSSFSWLSVPLITILRAFYSPCFRAFEAHILLELTELISYRSSQSSYHIEAFEAHILLELSKLASIGELIELTCYWRAHRAHILFVKLSELTFIGELSELTFYRWARGAHILSMSSWSSHSLDELAKLTFCQRAHGAHMLSTSSQSSHSFTVELTELLVYQDYRVYRSIRNRNPFCWVFTISGSWYTDWEACSIGNYPTTNLHAEELLNASMNIA